jgi:twitching motility protein PilT
MASLDKLLQTLTSKRMDELVVAADRPALLRRGESEFEVTNVPLSADTVRAALAEVAPPGRLASALPGEPVEFDYALNGTTYRFVVLRSDGGWSAIASSAAWVSNPTPAPTTEEGGSPTAEEPVAGSSTDPVSVTEEGGSPTVEEPVIGPSTDPVSVTEERGSPTVEEPATEPSTEPVSATAEASVSSKPMESMEELLEVVLQRDASDLHLSSQQPPRLRVSGALVELEGYITPGSEELRELLYQITPERNREQFEEINDTDFACELPGRARFRVNLFRDRLGVAGVLRQIPEQVPSFDELGLPEVLRRVADLTKGLVLVTGPTGCGKSTTLAALVDLVNESRPDHIITIEDPVEFVHQSKRCLIHQRQVGVHTTSFKHALRAALREDPDIVLVGEMRDLETVSTAIETAETGHLVFGTLHTTTAPSTIERLVDQFPADQQSQVRVMLADSLFAVVSQTLLAKIGGGRVAAFEVLIGNPAVSNLIREGKTFQIPSAMQTGKRDGMIRLNDSLMSLVEKKIVEPKEAYLKAVDKQDLLNKYQAAGVEFEAPGSGEEPSAVPG